MIWAFALIGIVALAALILGILVVSGVFDLSSPQKVKFDTKDFQSAERFHNSGALVKLGTLCFAEKAETCSYVATSVPKYMTDIVVRKIDGQAGCVEISGVFYSNYFYDSLSFYDAGDNFFLNPKSLTIINSNPAFAWKALKNSGNNEIGYARALDPDGTKWGDPVLIATIPSGELGSDDFGFAQINSGPAVAYIHQVAGPNSTLFYARVGSAPVSVATEAKNWRNASLTDVGGRPAIAFTVEDGGGDEVRFVRANDATGSTWPAPVVVTSSSLSDTGIELQMVNGKPAILYRGQTGNVSFIRATDDVGGTWPVAAGFVGAAAGPQVSLLTREPAFPVLAYISGDQVAIHVASDIDGSAWEAKQDVKTSEGAPVTADFGLDLALDQNALVVSVQRFGELNYIRSQDAEGKTWGDLIYTDIPSQSQYLSSTTLSNGNVAFGANIEPTTETIFYSPKAVALSVLQICDL